MYIRKEAVSQTKIAGLQSENPNQPNDVGVSAMMMEGNVLQ